MAIEVASFVEEPCLGGCDPATDMYGGALAQDPSGLRGDRAEEVDLEFDRCVPDPGGEHSVDGTAHRGVE